MINKTTMARGVSKEQALKNRQITKQRVGNLFSGVKNYGKSVAGGARIVGGGIKRVANKIF